jgi:hypothetical protein
MFSPDSYLYDTNLSLLATLSEEEIADPALVAQIVEGPSPIEAVGHMLLTLVGSGLARLVAAFAYTPHVQEPGAEYWLLPPLY